MKKYRKDVIQSWDSWDFDDLVNMYNKGRAVGVGIFKNGDILVYDDETEEKQFVVFYKYGEVNDSKDYTFISYFSCSENGIPHRNYHFVYDKCLRLANEEEKLILFKKISDNGIL